MSCVDEVWMICVDELCGWPGWLIVWMKCG